MVTSIANVPVGINSKPLSLFISYPACKTPLQHFGVSQFITKTSPTKLYLHWRKPTTPQLASIPIAPEIASFNKPSSSQAPRFKF